MAGQRYLSADLALRKPRAATQGIGKLGAREREVFVLLARGRSPKQVAGDLGISVKIAYVHRANVLAKVVARSDRDLYRIALDNGALQDAQGTCEQAVIPPKAGIQPYARH